MPTKINQQILEELIYDRIRTRLAIRELRAVDAELRRNIQESLRGVGETKEERDAVALELLERAWQRFGAEAESDQPGESEGLAPFAAAAA